MNRFWSVMGGNRFWGRWNRFDRRLSVVLAALSAVLAAIAVVMGEWSEAGLFLGSTAGWLLMYVLGVWTSSDARLLHRTPHRRRRDP